MSRFVWIRKVWGLVVAVWNRGRPRLHRVFAAGRARVRLFARPIVIVAASVWNQIVAAWNRSRQRVHRAVVAGRARVRLLAWLIGIAVALVGIWLLFHSWDWLSDGESGSTTLRNLGLMIAGFIALWLAVWRSRVAERQAATAEQGLLNERYQQGTAMLGNDIISVRLGGIYSLQRLAEEHPEQHHIQIMQLFCAFVRNPTIDESAQPKKNHIRTELDSDENKGVPENL